MCAIIDASVLGSMFGEENTQPSAAREFRRRVDKGKLLLVIGGKLKRELIRNSNFRSNCSPLSGCGPGIALLDHVAGVSGQGDLDSDEGVVSEGGHRADVT